MQGVRKKEIGVKESPGFFEYIINDFRVLRRDKLLLVMYVVNSVFCAFLLWSDFNRWVQVIRGSR